MERSCWDPDREDSILVVLEDACGPGEGYLASIIAVLRAIEDVELRGFGGFRLRDRRARIGQNPRRDASIQVPPKRVANFKRGKRLRRNLVDK